MSVLGPPGNAPLCHVAQRYRLAGAQSPPRCTLKRHLNYSKPVWAKTDPDCPGRSLGRGPGNAHEKATAPPFGTCKRGLACFAPGKENADTENRRCKQIPTANDTLGESPSVNDR